MTPAAFWSGRAGAICLCVAVALLLFVGLTADTRLKAAFDQRREVLARELRFLRSSWTAEAVLISLGAAVVASLALALTGRVILALALTTLAPCAVRHLMTRARIARVTRIEEQLESWLTLLAGALEATPSLGEALRTSHELVDPPLADELTQVLREHRLGSPLDRALDASAERVNGRTFSTALLTLRVGRNTGGSLQELLRETAANLREMARIEGVIRTKTAEGKAQASVIALIPAPLYLGLRTMNPGFFSPLETTFTGHVILGVAGALWLCAALLARRILAVDT